MLHTCGIELSGLFAQAHPEPRAVVVALHGGGMSAGYFDGRAHPDISLLRLGPSLGFSVLALDRPGYGRSRSALPAGQSLREQAELVFAALDDFARTHAQGGGVFVIGHSYGLKVGIALAAHRRGGGLLGLDGSGAGYHYRPGLQPTNPDADTDADRSTVATRSPRELFWGTESLYPTGTFAPGMRPIAPVPSIESAESGRWPELLPVLAAEVRIPFQFTVAEHEQWWDADDEALAEYRMLFTSAPTVSVRRQPYAGHNISLGWAARAYHLAALAFAEQCLLARRRSAAEVESVP